MAGVQPGLGRAISPRRNRRSGWRKRPAQRQPERRRKERRQTMQRLQKSLTVPTLTMLWLILSPGLVAGQPSVPPPSSDRTVVVPESLLRRATAHIDSLDLELRFAKNRAAESDSVSASTIRFYKGMEAQAWKQAEAWERRANSWWHQNKSAFWVALGALLAAIGLR